MQTIFRIVSAFLLTLSSTCWAASADSSRQLETVRDEIQTLDADLTNKKQEKEALYQQLKSQSKRISGLKRELRKIDDEISAHASKLKQLESAQQQQQQQQQRQLDWLNQQIRAAYIQGQTSYLKVLLSQQNITSISRHTAYFRYFHNARQAQLAEISSSLQNLTEEQKAVFAAQRTLQQLYEKQLNKQASLEKQSQQRQLTLAALEKQITTTDSRLAALREQEKNLQSLLNSLSKKDTQTSRDSSPQNNKPFAKLSGSLNWPVNGKLVARYGSSRNLGKLTWQGIMIASPVGSEVKASASGTVVFADWLRGFGLLVIVDHGDKYMTLYGNNEALLKQVGDHVNAGDVIAQSGNQGVRQHAGLYFEIRHKGSPTNPLKWLRRQG